MHCEYFFCFFVSRCCVSYFLWLLKIKLEGGGTWSAAHHVNLITTNPGINKLLKGTKCVCECILSFAAATINVIWYYWFINRSCFIHSKLSLSNIPVFKNHVIFIVYCIKCLYEKNVWYVISWKAAWHAMELYCIQNFIYFLIGLTAY